MPRLTEKFSPEIVRDILVLLSEFDAPDTTSWEKNIRAINPAFVLATPWNEYRLNRCRERTDKGEKAPYIHVTRYILNGERYYTLEDGNHRTAVAQERKMPYITARIAEEHICHPENYLLQRDIRRLLLCEARYMKVIAHATNLSNELMDALEAAGVTVQ